MEKSHEVSNRTCLMCDAHISAYSENDACEACAGSLGKPAFLFCNKCLEMWGVAPPGPMKYGMELKAGEKYHTMGCPTCSLPGIIDFKVVEIEGFERSFN